MNRHYTPPPATPRIALSFEDVWFSYESARRPVLRGAAFEVEVGQVVALVGRSGAGKSTCADMLSGLQIPDAGRVCVGGVDIACLPEAMLDKLVTVVPQETCLSNDTVTANIRATRPDADQADVERAARAAQAHEFIMRLPDGYATRCGEGGVRLSGGERQRIAIARAALRDTPVLVLDEATSSLDAESEQAMRTALTKLRRGRTLLIIAHRLSTLRAADWIIVLENGRVVEEGDHERLLVWNDRYARLMAAQTDRTLSTANMALEH